MNGVIIKSLTEKDTGLISQVKKLFVEMYDYYSQKGLTISLIKNGEELWMNSILPTLNRMNVLFVAVEEEEVVGFIYGYFSFTKDYMGSLKTGVIAETYVKQEIRKKGIGNFLVQAIENWFISKEVHSIELQVIFKNENAISFWEKHGYNKESFQFRKDCLNPNN